MRPCELMEEDDGGIYSFKLGIYFRCIYFLYIGESDACTSKTESSGKISRDCFPLKASESRISVAI